jgi:streptogramin lyase
MNRYSFLIALFLLLSPLSHIVAQGVGIGEWKDHLPYNNCIAVADAGDLLYCATPYSLFSIKKSDKTIERLNKITGLSDVGISAISYSSEYKTLLIAYTNADIDLIKDGRIINISDIKRKSIPEPKTINRVMFIGKYAYLSCGFGIVVLDVDREEIHDTYYIGPDGDLINVLDLTFNPVDNEFYAATEIGIFRANADDHLAYFASWNQDTTLPTPDGKYDLIIAFAGRVYANHTPLTFDPYQTKDTLLVYSNGEWNYFFDSIYNTRFRLETYQDKLLICGLLYIDVYDQEETRLFRIWTYNPGNPYPYDALLDSENNVWIADHEFGLVRNYNTWNYEKVLLDGPVSANVSAMDAQGTDLWVAPGGRDASFGSIYNPGAFYSFTDGKWNSYTSQNTPFLDSIRDVLAVAVDPRNPKHVFLGSWGFRLFEYLNGQLVQIYDASNSSLQYSIKQSDRLIIGGLKYDADNNLWIVNSNAPNLLSVLRNNNTWKSFDLGITANSNDAGGIAIDKTGQKWILQRDHTMIVFSDNNTIDNTADDQVKTLTGNIGSGALPGQYVQCVAVDQEGEVWIGTDEGIAVFYNPENVFSNTNFDAQRIVVKQGNNYGNLLETESITALVVNGDNQKWIGTDRAGVFLMSYDGQEQIYHFTEENSPLLSNSITSIALDDEGNVFFGTVKGIISYKDFATTPKAANDSVYVYPNPVKDTYDGPIAITNLVKDSDVKITDVNGLLVYKAKAKGGQAVWNGRNFEGRRANTGVYLVFISNEDGSETLVSKILFIN